AVTDGGVGRVAVFGVAFLASHYAVQALQLRVDGRSWRAALRRNLLCAGVEATLLPLACAIVLIWSPDRRLPFALLGATYLLVNWGFRRLAELAAELRGRVAELETLNRTAHALGVSLEVPQLLSSLLRETARALPGASRLEAVLGRGEGGQPERFVLEA